MDQKSFAGDVSSAVVLALKEREQRKAAASKAAGPMLRELKKLVQAFTAALPVTKHLGKVSGRSDVANDGVVHYVIQVINADGDELELLAEYDGRRDPAISMTSPSGEEFMYEDLDKLIEMVNEDIRRFLTTL